MTNFSNNKFHSILKKQQQLFSFTLPFGAHHLLVPLKRFHLGWEIRKGFFRYRLCHKIANNYLTLENSVVLTCQLARKSSLFSSPHKKLLKSMALPEFSQLLNYYGDLFTATLLQELTDGIMSREDAVKAPQRLQQLVTFYLSANIRTLHQGILEKQHLADSDRQRHKINIYFASIFEKLLANQKLLNSYIEFFRTGSDQPAILLKTLETLHLIFNNIGTTGVYETFFYFCRKYYPTADFSQLLTLAQKLTSYGDPELFKDTFCWANNAQLPPEIVNAALKNSLPLLVDADKMANATAHFSTYIKYLKDREMRL